MTTTLKLGIAAYTVGVFVFGWQTGKFGFRNAIFPRLSSARQGYTFFLLFLGAGGVVYVLKADEVRSLSSTTTIIAPLIVCVCGFVCSRLLITGTTNLFGLDMDSVSEVAEIRWQFLFGGAQSPVPALADRLGSILQNHDDWRVRRNAALTFGMCPSSEGLSYLITGLDDPDWRVQWMCINSIGRLGGALSSRGQFHPPDATRVLQAARAAKAKAGLHPRVSDHLGRMIAGLEKSFTNQS